MNKDCIDCYGEGLICNECGEAESNCGCDPDDQNVGDCGRCDGTGQEPEGD